MSIVAPQIIGNSTCPTAIRINAITNLTVINICRQMTRAMPAIQMQNTYQIELLLMISISI